MILSTANSLWSASSSQPVTACKKPADTLPGLINDLRASVATEDRKVKDRHNVETLYRDRRYRDQRNGGQRGYPSRRLERGGRYDDHTRRYDKPRYRNNNKVCFVCKKPGCWSTKHSKEERQQHIRQYVIEHEGVESLAEQEEHDNTPESDSDNSQDNTEGIETLTLQVGEVKSTSSRLSKPPTMFIAQVGVVNGPQVLQQLATVRGSALIA